MKAECALRVYIVMAAVPKVFYHTCLLVGELLGKERLRA